MKKRTAFSGILRCLKPYAMWIALSLAAALVAAAGQLLAPFYAGRAVDCILEGAVRWEELAGDLLAIGLSSAGAAAAMWLLGVSNHHIVYGVLCDVRWMAFSKISRLPLRYLDARPYGDVANVIVADAEQFSDGLLLAFNQFFTGIFTIAGVLGVMLVMRWQVALAVFFITPLSILAARFISSRTHTSFRRQAETRAEEAAFVDEMLGDLKVVKAFCREEKNEEIFGEKNEALRRASLRAVFFSSTTNPTTRFINSLVYAAVAVLGGLSVIATAGTVAPFTAGNLMTFPSYANQYTKPFNEISEVLAEFQNALVCAGRIFSLVGEEEEPSDEGLPALGRARGEVTAEDVAFSYTPERELIKGFDLRVKPGMRVAIVGPTGCGKTTLVNLLMRFYDVDAGVLAVDGKDIRTVTRASLRENYGMVLQETWLKEGTVRENLVMGRPDCTEAEMVAAAKAAHAHSFIRLLPQGYDTVIGDEGVLSAGQKQLLCIARVMVCRPPMLILDEATSNIDTRTERLVQEAFAELMEGRTSFVVAHRLSTIENADLILVMKAGKVVEQGTHEELLAREGFYASLYRAGFSG